MKKHEKRFIIEVKNNTTASGWARSTNNGLQSFYATREEAQAALANGTKSPLFPYRVRMK